MHSKSDKIEIMISDETDQVTKELFDSLKNRYQNNLGSMKGSDLFFDYAQLFYYKYHKINSRKFERNNVALALNVMYAKKEKIYLAYVSKHNSNLEKKVIFLMILNGDKQWHYLAVKKRSALLRRITSKDYGDCYCLNCHHFFATEKKFESYKKVCENKEFCNVIMPSEDAEILDFNQYQKSDKASFIIYANLEGIIVKIDG